MRWPPRGPRWPGRGCATTRRATSCATACRWATACCSITPAAPRPALQASPASPAPRAQTPPSSTPRRLITTQILARRAAVAAAGRTGPAQDAAHRPYRIARPPCAGRHADPAARQPPVDHAGRPGALAGDHGPGVAGHWTPLLPQIGAPKCHSDGRAGRGCKAPGGVFATGGLLGPCTALVHGVYSGAAALPPQEFRGSSTTCCTAKPLQKMPFFTRPPYLSLPALRSAVGARPSLGKRFP